MLVGPEGYFKIVIDDFDGETIKAWHWEGPNGGLSSNMVGGQSSGKNLDALIHRGNSTVNQILGERATSVLDHYLQNVPPDLLQ